MYAGDKLKSKLGGYLKAAVILFLVVVMFYIGSMLLDQVEHGDANTFTVNDASEESTACKNAEGAATLNGAGIKVPVKCKK